MYQHPPSTNPASSTPNTDDHRDGNGNGSESSMRPTEPASGEVPGLGFARPNMWPAGLSSLPSFSALARGQHLPPQSRPRIRRRDALPAGEKHRKRTAPSLTAQEPTPTQLSASSPHLTGETSASSTELHREDKQLANNPSRHHFKLPTRSNEHGTTPHPTTAGGGSSSSSRFARFSYMPNMCLQAGGNAMVADLEVDEDADDDHSDAHLLASLNLRDVRHPPMVDEPQQQVATEQQSTTRTAAEPITAPAKEHVSLPFNDPTISVPVSQPHDNAPITITKASNPPPDVSDQQQELVSGATESAAASEWLPLSRESLAMPRHAPVHSDVASSAYDLRGWLETCSTIEAETGTATSSNTTSRYSATPSAATRPWHTRPLPALQQQAAYRLDRINRDGLTGGPSQPVDDLEVDMMGVDVDNVEVDNTPAPASIHSADYDGIAPIITTYLFNKGIKSHAEANGQHVPLSQRIHMAHLEAEYEAALQQAGRRLDGAGADELPSAGDGTMDVDMQDSASLGVPAGEGSDDGKMAFRRYMGPIRAQLSAEAAMRCANLVHSRPRMRRRPTDAKRNAPKASSGRGSLGTDAASGPSSSTTLDRRSRTIQRREAARLPSRNLLAQAQAQIQARFEDHMEKRARELALPGVQEDPPPEPLQTEAPQSHPPTDAGPPGLQQE